MKLNKPANVKSTILTEDIKENYKTNVIDELTKIGVTSNSATSYVNTYFPILIQEWEIKHKKYPTPKDFALVLINFSQWSARMYNATAYQEERKEEDE